MQPLARRSRFSLIGSSASGVSARMSVRYHCLPASVPALRSTNRIPITCDGYAWPAPVFFHSLKTCRVSVESIATRRWVSLSKNKSIGSLTDSVTRRPHTGLPATMMSGAVSILDVESMRVRRLHAQQRTRTLSLSRFVVPIHQSPEICTTDVRQPFSSAATGAAGAVRRRTARRPGP